jgi:phosphate/phosphite/phosphonate ABC transporter binding protein
MESIDDNAVTIHFATFLSPTLYGTYEHIARYIGEKVDCPTTLRVGQSFDEFTEGQIDFAFICGLPYVRMASQYNCPVELLAAPVLIGKRYQHRPIYFSDVIVRRESPYTCFNDLHGCVWAYNERASHSGCNLVCYSLLEQDKSHEYFGETVKSGSHLRSIEMVLQGEVDAAAIDSHLLDVLCSRDEKLATRLRVVDALGPSSIPPIVVSKRLDDELKCKMQEVLVTMHLDDCGAKGLREGFIERFVAVVDEGYSDLRGMLDRVERVVFPFE